MSEARGQFTFYRSFWEAVQKLPKKDRLPVLEAIIIYALDGDEVSGLSMTQDAFFSLCKPTLDASRKKAANGKQGGKSPKQSESKTEANGKQTGTKDKRGETASEKEKENEIEKEKEIEKEYEEEKEKEIKSLPVLVPEVKAEDVFSFYLDKFNAAPSPLSLDKLKGYCQSLSPAVVLHALHIACDDKKFTFSYVEAILQRYSREGLNTLVLVQEAEQQRASKKAQEAAQPERHKATKIFGGTGGIKIPSLEELDALVARI